MQNSYDRIAKDWHDSRRGFSAQKYIDLLLTRLEPGVKILDLGCGTGMPTAKYLIENGFEVVGVDESAKMLEIARRVVPEIELIQADMRDVNFTARFAAVIAWDSMFHVGREHHLAIFQKFFSLLRPGGWLVLSAGGSGSEGFTSEMYGHTFFYSGFEPDETLRLLRTVGFEVDLCEVDDPSSRGHIAIIARVCL